MLPELPLAGEIVVVVVPVEVFVVVVRTLGENGCTLAAIVSSVVGLIVVTMRFGAAGLIVETIV